MCLKTIYCSIIRPVLECASVVWKPSNKGLSDSEFIQRKLSRYAASLLPWEPGSQHPPYEDHLMLLCLHQLKERRQIAHQLFVAGLLTCNIDSPILLQQLDLYAPTVPLRPRSLLAIPRRRSNYRSGDPLTVMSRACSHEWGFVFKCCYHPSLSCNRKQTSIIRTEWLPRDR